MVVVVTVVMASETLDSDASAARERPTHLLKPELAHVQTVEREGLRARHLLQVPLQLHDAPLAQVRGPGVGVGDLDEHHGGVVRVLGAVVAGAGAEAREGSGAGVEAGGEQQRCPAAPGRCHLGTIRTLAPFPKFNGLFGQRTYMYM